MSPASTCPTMMAAYMFDFMLVNAIWEPAFFSGTEDQRLMEWFGASLDTICDLASYVLRAIWTVAATLGMFYSPRYCPSFWELHMPYLSRTMPSHMWQGLCKPSFKDDGITASLACTFARHVAHWTCLGYGWWLIHQVPPAPTLGALWTRI